MRIEKNQPRSATARERGPGMGVLRWIEGMVFTWVIYASYHWHLVGVVPVG